MSRTVSARIPNEMHEELRERCNKVGCSINDYIKSSVEFALTGSTQFDFGDEESTEESSEQTMDKPKENHEGKVPVIHFHWENGKLVQGETTWEEKSKA